MKMKWRVTRTRLQLIITIINGTRNDSSTFDFYSRTASCAEGKLFDAQCQPNERNGKWRQLPSLLIRNLFRESILPSPHYQCSVSSSLASLKRILFHVISRPNAMRHQPSCTLSALWSETNERTNRVWHRHRFRHQQCARFQIIAK